MDFASVRKVLLAHSMKNSTCETPIFNRALHDSPIWRTITRDISIYGGIIKFSISVTNTAGNGENGPTRTNVPDGISDGSRFSQRVEGPFASPDRRRRRQRFVKIKSHELVLNTRTVFLFLFLQDVGCCAHLQLTSFYESSVRCSSVKWNLIHALNT